MAEHHQDQQAIANAVPANFGGVKQTAELAYGQKVLVPLVQISGFDVTACRPTPLYISPAGWSSRHGAISLTLRDPHSALFTKCAFCKEPPRLMRLA
jgi:hypothetical protein